MLLWKWSFRSGRSGSRPEVLHFAGPRWWQSHRITRWADSLGVLTHVWWVINELVPYLDDRFDRQKLADIPFMSYILHAELCVLFLQHFFLKCEDKVKIHSTPPPLGTFPGSPASWNGRFSYPVCRHGMWYVPNFNEHPFLLWCFSLVYILDDTRASWGNSMFRC